MSRLRRHRRDRPGLLWRLLAPPGHLLLIARLLGHFAGEYDDPASVELVSDMDLALVCKFAFRDPHTTVRANTPATCPVYVGGLRDGDLEPDQHPTESEE
jgi:hypothetical protein